MSSSGLMTDFSPKANWQWQFDTERATLMLNMGDYYIDIVYKANMLAFHSSDPVFFTIEDVANYIELFDSISLSDFPPEVSCTIIVHILAVGLFHKPLMPKSWLFKSVNSSSPEVNKGDRVTLTSSGAAQTGDYLVLENSDDFVLCMLVGNSHALTASKSLKQFQIVKVTRDKISVPEVEAENSWNSYQIF
ncbi:cell division protein ZapC domain-containing protein [Psychromonas ossibalaenae]|uniref:cell division protein ZapC domain-containing protein n=1 Tax=Psychromonas ossibalaenae TaxID=444922 RepID=UPI0003660815|nr:cell division protein ZapC domain-containing protein [Psychromonas ossibalaenae]